MKLNTIAAFAVATIATVAIAQAPTPLAVSFGKGVARNQANKAAEFDYEVVKLAQATPTAPGARGRFMLATTGENENQRVQVKINRMVGMAVNGNVAEFGGMGAVIVQTPTGRRIVEGRVEVRAVDNWTPPTNTTPGTTGGDDHPRDTIQVRVTRPGTSATAQPVVVFEYAGQVMRGNLVVRVPSTTGN